MALGSRNLTAVVQAANGTDTAVVTAVPGARICVVAVIANSVAGSVFTLNSKGSGAGTAIMGTVTLVANGLLVLPDGSSDWFRTNLGEGLTVTTAAATSVTVTYRLAN